MKHLSKSEIQLFVDSGFIERDRSWNAFQVAMIWSLSIVTILSEKNNLKIWLCFAIIGDIAFSYVFLKKVFLENNRKAASVFSQGMTTLYLSMIFSIFSYRLINEKTAVGPTLLLIILVILGMSYCLNSIIVVHRIRKKKYDTTTDLTQGLVLAGSMLASLVLRFFIKEIVPKDSASLVIALLCLIISCTFAYGVIFFIKYYLIKKYLETEDNSILQ